MEVLSEAVGILIVGHIRKEMPGQCMCAGPEGQPTYILGKHTVLGLRTPTLHSPGHCLL
jgi:hypothetical protein